MYLRYSAVLMQVFMMKLSLLILFIALVALVLGDEGSGGGTKKSCRKEYKMCHKKAEGILAKIKCGPKFVKCILNFQGDDESSEEEEGIMFDEQETEIEDYDEGSGGGTKKSCRKEYKMCHKKAKGILAKIKCGPKFVKCILNFQGDDESTEEEEGTMFDEQEEETLDEAEIEDYGDEAFDEQEALTLDEPEEDRFDDDGGEDSFEREVNFDEAEEMELDEEDESSDEPKRKNCWRPFKICRNNASSLKAKWKCIKGFRKCLIEKCKEKGNETFDELESPAFDQLEEESFDDAGEEDLFEGEENFDEVKEMELDEADEGSGGPKRKNCWRPFKKCRNNAPSRKAKWKCIKGFRKCLIQKCRRKGDEEMTDGEIESEA